jgi:hypothetical protein
LSRFAASSIKLQVMLSTVRQRQIHTGNPSDRTDPAPNTQKKPISPRLQNRTSKLQKEIAKMKSLRIAISLGLLAIATVALAQTSAQKSFDQLKTLTGSWEGKDSRGGVFRGGIFRITFEDIAGGSALMSKMQYSKGQMISIFHMDGPNRLMLSHFCSDGTQPRLIASASPDGKTITFDFLDATNLATPDAGHYRRIVLTMLDANHHTEDWTFNDHGKDVEDFFDLQRR